ncbi:MAG: dihydroorotase [Chitinophagaceae bacterium]|nr:dihydroorotase [Chitinophagaceae bacterium]
MKVLIKNAILTSSTKKANSTDILIDNGIITQISSGIVADADHIIENDNLHVSVGWMDCFANFADPGDEYKETLETGAAAAAAGGFTEVMIIPNTNPITDNKSQVEYIKHKSKSLPVTIHPIGAITKNAEGKELSEMYDMHHNGALVFSDGINCLQSSGIMLKALQYIKAFDGTIIQLPDDKNIGTNGLMNEGIASTKLGLPGKPAIAEEILIARDIELLKYSNSKIHFTGISTKRSLELITQAKKKGLNISCSVTPYHVYFYEDDVADYDTNLKVNPPLRTKEDMMALRDGVKDHSIDFIASHHLPQDFDNKICEFEYAKYGMTGLESTFGVLCALDIPFLDFVKMQTENIRKIFGLMIPEIKIGEKANLTLFIPGKEYLFTEKNILSRSKNTPFTGKKLKGYPIGIINGDKLFLSDSHY